MFIRFNSIELNNFFSINNVKFAYEPGFHLVYGLNNDNKNSLSNGSGKTTLFSEGPRWILYGSTTKGSADSVINEEFGGDCYGILDLSLIHEDYSEQRVKITRYRGHSKYGNDLHLYIDGEDFSRHGMKKCQSKIEETLKLPQKIVASTYIMEQGLSGRFSLMSNVDRKNFFESIRDNKIWDTAWGKSKNKITSLDGRIRELEVTHASNSSVMASHNQSISELRNKILEQKSQLNAFNLEDLLLTIDGQYNALVTEYNELSSEYSRLLPDKEGFENDQKPLVEEVSNISTNIGIINSEISNIHVLLNSIACPSCKRPYENTDKVKFENGPRLVNLTQELKTHKLTLNKVNSEILELSGKIHNIMVRLNDITIKINHDINPKANNLLLKKKDCESKIDQINVLIKTFESSISEHEAKIQYFSDINIKISQELTLQHTDKSYYNELTKIFSFNGIRSFLLFNDLDFVNQKLREFSAQLYSDMMIQLRSGIDANGAMTSLDIVAVVNGNTTREFSKLSGGEKRRADVAIQLSIKELIKAAYFVDTNLNVIDEITDGLDSQGKSAVLDLIIQNQAQGSCTYVISHENLNINARSITVIKEGGRTYLN